jgi:hypothetical protein
VNGDFWEVRDEDKVRIINSPFAVGGWHAHNGHTDQRSAKTSWVPLGKGEGIVKTQISPAVVFHRLRVRVVEDRSSETLTVNRDTWPGRREFARLGCPITLVLRVGLLTFLNSLYSLPPPNLPILSGSPRDLLLLVQPPISNLEPPKPFNPPPLPFNPYFLLF